MLLLWTFVSSFTGSVCQITTAGECSSSSPSPPHFFSTALDAALEFQQQFAVPSTWKTEVKEESSSSEDDDEDEDEEQEEDASGEEAEVEASAAGASQLRKRPQTLWFSVCRRRWNLSQRRGRTFCSNSTSLWKTEVSPRRTFACFF